MNYNLSQYINHPETMDENSLGFLSRLVQNYPYFHAARLLYLRNLYQLHNPAFDKELRRAAFFLPCRQALFNLIERDNFQLKPEGKRQSLSERNQASGAVFNETADRTGSLIDSFLAHLPEEKPRRPKPIDASSDYMGFLMQSAEAPTSIAAVPRMQHQDLIDDFIGQGDKRIVLDNQNVGDLQMPNLAESNIETEDEDYFTETLAKIYIKQGRYNKAMEIIKRLSLKYPKKNRYFADQIRFLDKLIINNKNKKQ